MYSIPSVYSGTFSSAYNGSFLCTSRVNEKKTMSLFRNGCAHGLINSFPVSFVLPKQNSEKETDSAPLFVTEYGIFYRIPGRTPGRMSFLRQFPLSAPAAVPALCRSLLLKPAPLSSLRLYPDLIFFSVIIPLIFFHANI